MYSAGLVDCRCIRPTHLATVAEIEAVVADTEDVEIAGSFMRGVGVPAVIADARAAAHRLLR